MKSLKLLSASLVLTTMVGCAQLGAKVEMADGRILTENAFIAEQQFLSESECYKSKSGSSVAIAKDASAAQAVSIALGNVMSMLVASKNPCGGTNINDVKIATSAARWGFGSSVVRGVVTGYGFGQAADFGISLARAKSNTYNTDLSSVNQTTGSSSEGGATSGPLDEFGVAVAGDTTQASDGVSSYIINIGGNVSMAGERAAAGDTALVNGDSSVISAVEDSELKGAYIAEDIIKNDDQSTFSDDDGGNGILDF